MKKVNEISKSYGISIRTLHYYDDLGLVVPNRLNGIRIYSHENEKTLRKVLLLRELDFTLSEIQDYLDGGFDFLKLKEKRETLINKRNRINEIISMIDTSIISGKEPKSIDELFNPFGTIVRETIGDQRLSEIIDDQKIDFNKYIIRLNDLIEKLKTNLNKREAMAHLLLNYHQYINELTQKKVSRIEFVDMISDNIDFLEPWSESEKNKFINHLSRYKNNV